MILNLQKLNSTSGYSLVESIVAFVLLTTVLVPLVSIVVKLATHRDSLQRIEAFAIAQAAIEYAVSDHNYVGRSEIVNEKKWLVKEEYSFQDNLVIIKITVSRRGRTGPQIALTTARLMPALP